MRIAGGMAGLVMAGVVAVAPAQAAYPPPPGGPIPVPQDQLPRVNMEKVLLAAQWDPAKSGTGITKGAKKSVLRVERALHKKGLLAKSLVDGHFGSTTVSAYAAWQRRLGYSGLAANGLPGETSLKRLGRKRFKVGHIVSVGARTTYDGNTVNARTKRMLTAAAHILRPGCQFDVTQGSYNPGGVDASATTHDGGGAADISVNHTCGRRVRFMVRALRRVGFAAWHRLPSQGPWPAHIHAIAVSDPDLSAGAQDQVGDYYEGRNGLSGGAADDGPKVPKRTWEQYKRAH
jgi:hypothetical protein